MCHPSTWTLVQSDFLRHVYPLLPVVHVPTYLRDMQAHNAVQLCSMTCLRLSTLAAVISIVPDRFDQYQSHDSHFKENFHTKLDAVETAEKLFDQVRGSNFYDDPTTDKWAALKLLGAAYSYLRMSERAGLYRLLSYEFALRLEVHIIKSYAGLDPREMQLRKRVLWISLTGMM